MSGARERLSPTVRDRIYSVLPTVWLLIVAAIAVFAARAQWERLQTLLQLYSPRRASLWFACGTIALGFVASLTVGLLQPQWWRRWCLVLLLFPTAVLLLASGNVAAGVAALGILGPVVWAGCELATRLLPDLDRVEAWSVGGAIGAGGVAVLGLVLGRVAALRPWSIAVVLVLIVAFLLLVPASRRRVRADLESLWRWSGRAAQQSFVIYVFAGVAIGTLWIAYIGALAPEIMADAIRQRLASDALLARMGRSPVADPDLTSAANPGAGELIYAVALTVGPLQTAKLVNGIVGLLALLGVWSLGRRIGGGQSGFIAALAFGTLPITLWLAQTAYIDLFATLFAISCAVVLAAARRSTWRIVAFVCGGIGIGLAVKMSFGSVAIGLLAALAVGLLWTVYESPRRALAWKGGGLAIVFVLLGLLFWRGIDGPFVSLRTLWEATSGQFGYYQQFGSGRSIVALLRAPLDLTLHTGRYGEQQDGAVGYLLLALVPLLVLVRPRRTAVPLLVAALVASLVWFTIAQYVRYALPILAFWCALAGLAYRAVDNGRVRAGFAQHLTTGIGLAALLGSGFVGYLNTVLVYPGTVPYAVVLGLQREDDYLVANVAAYNMIQVLNREPGATRAMTTGEYARLYATVQMSGVGIASYVQDEQELLAYLDEQRFSHILIDRERLADNWNEFLVFNEQFLRRNTRLVGGSRNAYLYRIVPPAQRDRDQEWARGPELLPNVDFDQYDGELPRGWQPVGLILKRSDIALPDSVATVIRVSANGSFFSAVPIQPGRQYLLSEVVRAVEVAGLSRLQINWLDSSNSYISTSIEVVPTSPNVFRQFSMLAVAPDNATTAVVYVQAQQGEVWFDRLSLRAVDDPR